MERHKQSKAIVGIKEYGEDGLKLMIDLETPDS